MPNYNYEALNDKGKVTKGVMNADGVDSLEYKLQEIGLELITQKNASSVSFSLFSNSVTKKDLILLCTHFEQLDKAGVPITEAIEDLRDSGENPRFRDLMQSIYDSVKDGKLLSESMAEHPKIFDEVFVGLISAGEKTGNMAQSFNYLSEHLKWSMEISRKTKKAVRYPIFLLLIVFLVLAVMMTVVIPKLSDFLIQQDFSLPFYTKALISFSDFFVAYWKSIIMGLVTIFIMNKLFIKFNEKYSYAVDALILKLPFVGSTMLKIDISRFSQFFLITFKSGIDIIECFNTVNKVVHNKVMKRKIEGVKADVSGGANISLALRNAVVFPSLVVRMFEVGEKTGNMEESLSNVKYFYDKEVNDSVEALVGIIQPALTLTMGGLLLWISLSVFGPLYSSFGQIR